MTLETLVTEITIPFLGNYFFILALLGTIFTGNLFILFISTLSGQGILIYWKILLVTIVGTWIADILWFTFGKSHYLDNLLKRPHFIYNYYYIKQTLIKSSEKNLFVVFLTSKFALGSRLLTLIYAGRKDLKFSSFIKYNFISSAIWVFVLVNIGWIAGKGFSKILEILQNMKTSLIIFLLLMLILYVSWGIIGESIRKHIINKTKRMINIR